MDDQRLPPRPKRPRPQGGKVRTPRGNPPKPSEEPVLDIWSNDGPMSMTLPKDPYSEETLQALTRLILRYWRKFKPQILEPEDLSDPNLPAWLRNAPPPEELARSQAEQAIYMFRTMRGTIGPDQAWSEVMREIVLT